MQLAIAKDMTRLLTILDCPEIGAMKIDQDMQRSVLQREQCFAELETTWPGMS